MLLWSLQNHSHDHLQRVVLLSQCYTIAGHRPPFPTLSMTTSAIFCFVSVTVCHSVLVTAHLFPPPLRPPPKFSVLCQWINVMQFWSPHTFPTPLHDHLHHFLFCVSAFNVIQFLSPHTFPQPLHDHLHHFLFCVSEWMSFSSGHRTPFPILPMTTSTIFCFVSVNKCHSVLVTAHLSTTISTWLRFTESTSGHTVLSNSLQTSHRHSSSTSCLQNQICSQDASFLVPVAFSSWHCDSCVCVCVCVCVYR